jgi:hypothetical protein
MLKENLSNAPRALGIARLLKLLDDWANSFAMCRRGLVEAERSGFWRDGRKGIVYDSA